MSTSPTVAFNMANLVAYFTDYRFQLKQWGQQHKLTAEKMNAEAWTDMCGQIRAAGYDAVEVWVALIERCGNDETLARTLRRILAEHGLRPLALGGTLNDATAKLCNQFGIPACCGGYWGSDHDTVVRLSRATGIAFNYENHPETSVQAIREQVRFGADGLAVAVDTGWLGSRGLDVPAAVRELGRLIRHVHVKDVAAPGSHETVRLGEGCVDIPGVLRELKAIGYDGPLSWEDEPEDRNPFDIAAEMREYILTQWGRS